MFTLNHYIDVKTSYFFPQEFKQIDIWSLSRVTKLSFHIAEPRLTSSHERGFIWGLQRDYGPSPAKNTLWTTVKQ